MLGSDCPASCPDISVCAPCSEGWGTQPPSASVPSSIRWRWSFHPCGIIVCHMWVHKCEALATGPGVEDIVQDYFLFFSALWCLSISQGYCLFPEQIVGATALQPCLWEALSLRDIRTLRLSAFSCRLECRPPQITEIDGPL